MSTLISREDDNIYWRLCQVSGTAEDSEGVPSLDRCSDGDQECLTRRMCVHYLDRFESPKLATTSGHGK